MANSDRFRWRLRYGDESPLRRRGVLDDHSKGVFRGRVIVRPGAQKTDAKMMTRALLLSDEAQFASKPELEIFADDVRCGHGATAGDIDQTMLFYLMSRGLPRKEAERLLIESFLDEAIDAIDRLVELLPALEQHPLGPRTVRGVEQLLDVGGLVAAQGQADDVDVVALHRAHHGGAPAAAVIPGARPSLPNARSILANCASSSDMSSRSK